MKTAPNVPDRPLLRYYGGKWRLAPWIISFFPPHQSYVEPCGGAASVLLQKPRSQVETYNDLDGSVVNFLRVLRDQPNELIHKIELTPWSRSEYELSAQPHDDPIEQARRTFAHIMMSIPGTRDSSDGQWRHWTKFIGTPLSMYTETLEWAVDRLHGVQFECVSYQRILNDYDTDETLFYFDPPYVTDTRTSGNIYTYEWTDTEHAEASELLNVVQGYVVISGYACPLYSELYEAHRWQRYDCKAQTSGEVRIESVWLSPRTIEALKMPRQAELFR